MATIGHNTTVSINALSIDDRKTLRKTIEALNDSFTRVAAERDLQKEAINEVYDKLGVDKKIIRRMAKAYFSANFNSVVEDDKNFEEFYETIMKQPLPNEK